MILAGGTKAGLFEMGGNQDCGDEQYRDFDIWLGIEGSATAHWLGQQTELRKGRLILIPAGVKIRLRTPPGASLRMLFCHFDCLLKGKPLRDTARFVDARNLTLTLPGLPSISLIGEVDTGVLAQKLLRFRNLPDDDLAQLSHTILLMDVFRHLRATRKSPRDSLAAERLEKAIHYLESRLDHDISLRELARHAAISPETLGRLFRAHYQTSPMQYLMGLRLCRARDLLQSRRLNISEVGFACGFNSIQYFSRAFRRQYGMSPQTFRDRHPQSQR